jgi:hypothetical protein
LAVTVLPVGADDVQYYSSKKMMEYCNCTVLYCKQANRQYDIQYSTVQYSTVRTATKLKLKLKNVKNYCSIHPEISSDIFRNNKQCLTVLLLSTATVSITASLSITTSLSTTTTTTTVVAATIAAAAAAQQHHHHQHHHHHHQQ